MSGEKRIMKILKKTGVLQEGHFILSSGKHAAKYLQCAQVLQFPSYANELARGIAEKWSDKEIDVVIGPALGGIVISYVVGQALGVRSIFAERNQGDMQLRRGFTIKPDEKVLLVEDVVTTGGSVREVFDLLENQKADIVGISSIIDRSGGQVDFKYPLKALLELNIETFEPETCKLCAQDIPVTKPGSKK